LKISDIKLRYLVVFFLISCIGNSQTEQGLLPFSNKLLLNPSFAGLDKHNSVWSNFLYSAEPDNHLKHLYSVTYDTWSEALKGGVGLYFYQGLEAGIHTNHTGAGFSYSKPIVIGDSEIIPSVNLNYYLYTKQWLVYVIDGMVDKSVDPYNPPGVDFMRYHLLTPRVGLLLNSPHMFIGTSVSYSYRNNLVQENNLQDDNPIHFLFHAAKKINGNENGLLFRPFKSSPEAVVIYSENLLLSRVGIRMENVDRMLGFFVSNNFTEKHHGISGIYGWRLENFKIALTLGGAYSIPAHQTMYFGELSLGLVIPYKIFDEENPWAPPVIPN
jgi:hypothetical protein